MLRRAIILALGLMFLIPLLIPVAAQEEETGSVNGTVLNGTEDGEDVAGLTVELSRFEGMDLVETFETTVDENGSFFFEDLSTEGGQAYLASVEYNDLQYRSSMILLSQEPDTDVEISVFETTDDPSVIDIVSRGVVIVTADADTALVEVLEIIAIENTSDRTYVGQNETVLQLGMPERSTSIAPQAGFDFGEPRVEDDSLITTGPINPGSHNPMISYSVPYEGTTARITLTNAMDTQTLRILVREDSYNINSSVLTPGEPATVGSDEYEVMAMDEPVPGDVITFSVTGLPRENWNLPMSMGALLASLAAGVGLVVGAVLIYQVVQRRGRYNAEEIDVTSDHTSDQEQLERERLALASELNKLDDEHNSDKLDEETYQKEREEILEELREITVRMRGQEESQ